MKRRTLLAAAVLPLALPTLRSARADTTGVTATEIKIGHFVAYSGPASAYGVIGKTLVAFMRMVNDQGGVSGRKINFITVDDGYAAPRAVEAARRLVEQDEVSFLLNPLGTASNSAIQKYMNAKKVPQLFVATGADKWADPQRFPWTMGWQPSYRTEGQIYAKYINANLPYAKIAVIYQNDDFGKDYLAGLRDVFGDKYSSKVVKQVSFEVTDATIDSQAVTLKASGADVLVTAATPKFAAQMIRKVFDLGWKPAHFLTNVSVSVASVMEPAGAEKGIGVISAAYNKDAGDPTWAKDPGMLEWRAFMAKYIPDGDLNDTNYVFGYGVGVTAMQVLRQCGADLSRENIMKQAASLHDLVIPTHINGIKINTSATNYHPIQQMQLMKWTGKQWELFGNVIEGSAI
jgi:branched-chain amino acid transport system substrate-binding protein